MQDVAPAPHLERTWLTWVFTTFYAVSMLLAGYVFIRRINEPLPKPAAGEWAICWWERFHRRWGVTLLAFRFRYCHTASISFLDDRSL